MRSSVILAADGHFSRPARYKEQDAQLHRSHFKLGDFIFAIK